ncbi:MAG: hypothetical protein LC808_19385, partial [Actinobacteria bacterium]|nr:hypothetical protein [Actinomycetota bacterium]
AAYQIMFRLVRDSHGAILAANLYPSHVAELNAASSDLLQIFCDCPPRLIQQRFHERAPSRHRGHLDDERGDSDISALGGAPLPLDVPLLRVDTSAQVDVEAVARWVASQVTRLEEKEKR